MPLVTTPETYRRQYCYISDGKCVLVEVRAVYSVPAVPMLSFGCFHGVVIYFDAHSGEYVVHAVELYGDG